MNPSQLQNEEKKQEWTIVYDRAVPPAHSATFASQVGKSKPESSNRRGVTRTLTPPACRWVEQSSTENAAEPDQSPIRSATMLQEDTTELSEVTPGSTLPSATSERINDANPRLPQRLPVGSCLSPMKKSKKSQHESQTH
jgi:hypothetical protein